MTTTKRPLGVGVIGASLGKSWGAGTHLPALQHLPAYRILAVGSSRTESARATADAFGVPLAFTEAERLIAHPDIEVVSICVKVPHHRELIRAAITQGKHVYCEWPLAVGLSQAEEMASLAAQSPERHMIGLQGMRSPWALRVRELIEHGRMGRVLSVALTVRLSGYGEPTVPLARLHTVTPQAGTTLLTVGVGHALATLTAVLGPLRSLSAVMATRTPTITVAETGEHVTATSPDQVTVAGTLHDGAAVSIAVLGGAQRNAAHFSLQIVGSDATLDIEPRTPGLPLQIADWAIHLSDSHGTHEVTCASAEGPAGNVVAMYAALAESIATGGPVSPGFDVALAIHRLLAGIERSAATGRRVAFTNPS